MGEWILKIPASVPEHKCVKPSSETEKFAPGSLWECSCGARWKFMRQSFDQRENSSWDEWELQNAAELRAKATVRRADFGPAPSLDWR